MTFDYQTIEKLENMPVICLIICVHLYDFENLFDSCLHSIDLVCSDQLKISHCTVCSTGENV